MKRTRLLLLLLLLLLPQICSCAQGGAPTPYAYLDHPWQARIGGAFLCAGRELPFEAEAGIYREESGVCVRYLRYFFRGEREALTLTLRADDTAEIAYKDLRTTLPAQALGGLLSPLRALLTKQEIRSLQKSGGGLSLALAGGGELCLSAEGNPQSFRSTSLFFKVFP